MQQPEPQVQPPSIFAEYNPLPGVYDEALTETGARRPAWKRLLTQLDAMGEIRLRQTWQRAHAQIERDGVTYNPYDDDGLVARPWLLDAIPMVLTDSEWNPLCTRLDQRARVLDALLKDLLGEQRLIRDGVIPPDLLFGHPAWYPAYQNLHAGEKHRLTICVTDLARAPDGQWWATGDRTRAPFGLGYVLENRIVTSRMLSGIFRSLPIRRLAGFYAAVKQELRRLAPRSRDNPRIVLWTKGPQSRGYFEDSYLARYLGYTLAEGDDLAVRDNRVQLLTLGGLLPVEVLLRRVDDDDCDSVELNPDSRIGISALLDVIRTGGVAVANSVGSRIVESPAFLPFLSAASKYLLGEDLQLPSVATWWCGDDKAKSHVLANITDMLIRPAFRMADVRPTVGRSLSQIQRKDLIAQINANPAGFVGQEIIDRSTTPVLTDRGVEPWYTGLRTFHVADGNRFRTLPGGLARVSADSDSLNFTMTDGERSQDIWIVADHNVQSESLLGSSVQQISPRRSGAELPSRVADNFFWMGRYAERAMQTTLLLRTLFAGLDAEEVNTAHTTPLLRVLADQGQIDPDHLVPELSRTITEIGVTLPAAVLDPARAHSLLSSVRNTVRTATRVRDRISTGMWRSVDRLNSHFVLAEQVQDKSDVDIPVLLDAAMSELAALIGLVAEGMTRTLGWRFFDLGCRIERAWQTTSLLKGFLGDERNDDPDSLETLLTTTDCLMTYRSRYLATMQVPVVLDLLLTDTTNPRSVIWQLNKIDEHLVNMPGGRDRPMLTREQKMVIALAGQVRLIDIFAAARYSAPNGRTNLKKVLGDLDAKLPRLSDLLSSRFLIHAGLPRHFGISNPHLS